MYSFYIVVKSKVPKSNNRKIKDHLHMIDLLDKPLPKYLTQFHFYPWFNCSSWDTQKTTQITENLLPFSPASPRPLASWLGSSRPTIRPTALPTLFLTFLSSPLLSVSQHHLLPQFPFHLHTPSLTPCNHLNPGLLECYRSGRLKHHQEDTILLLGKLVR